MPAPIRLGIDTGGTFTDIVALNEDTGAIVATKVPSTPADPAEGFMTGVHKVLGLLGLGGGDLAAVSHGTTVATNQLLEGNVSGLGFITTEGYRHILEIARQSVPDSYGNSYFWVKPDRIVPADLVRTVAGRLDFRGHEIRPFDTEQAAATARWFRDRGINMLGVCFLHAYANPAHELEMRDILAAEHPACIVSLSSEVLREYREYERAVTTLVDAAVKPTVMRYITTIKDRFDTFTERAQDVPRRVPFYIMKSNGGVLSADEVVHQPITTVLSGPAAGALGAALVAQRAGHDRVLTLDGGGTSTDVAVVLSGEPTLTTEGSVGAFPSKIPMIDVVSVGAGGGSVAWISPEGTLKVGPHSAGADPGPLCYTKGGTEPTITDAHLTLGRIPPHLLGGEIALNADAARDGLAKLARNLGLGTEDCARGALEVSVWNQANALRQVTVRRGLDVRDFVMVTFGGSGSLLLCRLIDILGLPAALVPRDPGNLSAFGLLTVDVKNDYVQTAVFRHADADPAWIAGLYTRLQNQAAEALANEGFPAEQHRFARTADLRYFGQAFEVRVPAPGGTVDGAFAPTVAESFHRAHEQLYGYCFRDDPSQQVEWVNLRVTGIGPIRRPDSRPLAASDGDPGRARSGTRPVCFGHWVQTPIYSRAGLAAGDRITGPAVIEEFGSTIPIHPGFAAQADPFGNIIVTRSGPAPGPGPGPAPGSAAAGSRP